MQFGEREKRYADLLYQRAEYDEALEVFMASLAIGERLAATDPGNAGWRGDLSVSRNKIGDVLYRIWARLGSLLITDRTRLD